jgi:hypothetical protein
MSLAAHLLFPDLFSFFRPFGPSRRTAPPRPKSVVGPFSFLPQPHRPSFICPTQPMRPIWPLARSTSSVQHLGNICCIIYLLYCALCFRFAVDQTRQRRIILKTFKSKTLTSLSSKASALDACCTYFLYLSIGLHVLYSCLSCGNTYVSYLSMQYPCYPGFG